MQKKKKRPSRIQAHDRPVQAQFQQLFKRIVLEAHSNDLSREHHSNLGSCSNSKLFVDALF